MSYLDTTETLHKVLRESLMKASQGKDLVSVQTLKHRVLHKIMADWGMSFSQYNQIFSTHSVVHAEIAKSLLHHANKLEDWDYILAQDFVKNEKLFKLFKLMIQAGYSNTANALLAIDGLGTNKISSSPCYDLKKYFKNLRYGLSGKEGVYDHEPDDDIKRMHVYAIRKLYEELYKHIENISSIPNAVYHIIRHLLKEVSDIDLPLGNDSEISQDLLNKCKTIYTTTVELKNFHKFADILKKNNKPQVCEDDTKRSEEMEISGKRKK